MRYHYEKPTIYLSMYGKRYICDHPVYDPYILRGVTEGLSYNALKMQYAIPCCREVYYNLYRRFFWLLSKERD